MSKLESLLIEAIYDLSKEFCDLKSYCMTYEQISSGLSKTCRRSKEKTKCIMNSVSDLNRARNTNLKNVVKLNKIETIKYSCTLKKNFAV